MQKSKIKVGDKVAVYTWSVRGPQSYKLGGNHEEKQPHGQITSWYGIDRRGYQSSYVAEATVLDLNATLYKPNVNSWYGTHNKTTGILVEFAEPQGDQNITTAVVVPRVITDSWEAHADRERSYREAQERWERERNEEKTQYLVERGEFDAIIKEAGLADAISVPTRRVRNEVVGWANDSVSINRLALLDLIQQATGASPAHKWAEDIDDDAEVEALS